MSKPRLFFAALPSPSVVAAMQAVVLAHKLDLRLGRDLFAPENWHQSLSERIFDPSDADIESLMAVGDAIRAHACTLSFNRIDSQLTQAGKIQWTLRARGKPTAFEDLKAVVQAALKQAGHPDIATGVTPHVTLSYGAPEMLEKIDVSPVIDWTLDEIMLVIGGGQPYRYEVIGRWPLLPEIDPPQQQFDMF